MRNSGYDRNADDWYVEPSWIVKALLDAEKFEGRCWDPSCGSGNIPRQVQEHGLPTRATDLRQRGAAETVMDFLDASPEMSVPNIISNPPYGIIERYIRHALTLATQKVAILARLALLEGQGRRLFFEETPLAKVWVSRKRVSMPPGGSDIPAKGGTVAYAWFVWDHTHSGSPSIGWL